MTKKLESHGYQLEFEKNKGKAIIELELGSEPQECYLIDIFSVNSDDYIALVPVDSDELYILRYDANEDDEENINLLAIEDEEELETVYHLFFHYWDEETIDNLIDDYMGDLENLDMDED